MSPDWLPVVIAGGIWIPVQPHQLTQEVTPPYGMGSLGAVIAKAEVKPVALPAACLLRSGVELSYSLACAERSK